MDGDMNFISEKKVKINMSDFCAELANQISIKHSLQP